MSRDDSLGFLLGRALRLHQQRSHQLMGDTGLHPGQAPIMFTLWRQDGQRQKDLAERLHLAPATVTVTVRRLEKAGLLERRKDDCDQRISRVYLTERGRSLRGTVMTSIHTTNSECLETFTSEDEALLKRYLLQITENLQEALRTAG